MRLPLLFLLCALPLGLVLARLVPVAQVPDETAHIVRAYAVSTGQLIGRRIPPGPGQAVAQSGYKVDTGLFSATLPSPAPREQETEAVADVRSGAVWSHRTMFAAVPNTATYAPVFYLLSGAALGAGRGLGLTPELAVAVARVANLLGFAALGAGALLVARRGRCLLFALLCLPSSLSLAASVNQDGLLIGAAVLGIALLTRSDLVARRWGALALAAVTMAKPPYLPLLGLLLMPVGDRWWRDGVGLAALAAVPAVLWSLAVLHWASVPFDHPAYAPGPLYAGEVVTFTTTDAAAQMAIVRAHPSLLLRLPLDTAAALWRTWLPEVVGVLGPLSLVLPVALYRAWYASLICAALGDVLDVRRPGAAAWSLGGAVIAPAAALLAAWLLLAVEYLIWTHVGAAVIEGVQGRYFVPLLAACALALPPLGMLRGQTADAPLAPAVAVSATQFVVVPLMVVQRWYLH